MTDKTDKPAVLRETDEEARRLARTLVRGARHMALAVIDPETGFPSASRALTATDLDGTPVILASSLSTHTKALLTDPRCSLLAGELGKGDPLAHPRITLQCRAASVPRGDEVHDCLRQRFLDRHPKASLYIDFPDFRFFRLEPQSASLNGGFGRAYALPGSDLVMPVPVDVPAWQVLQAKLREMQELAATLARVISAPKSAKWRFAGTDPAGFDLVSGDVQVRYEFDGPVLSPEAAFTTISKIAETGPRSGSRPEI